MVITPILYGFLRDFPLTLRRSSSLTRDNVLLYFYIVNNFFVSKAGRQAWCILMGIKGYLYMRIALLKTTACLDGLNDNPSKGFRGSHVLLQVKSSFLSTCLFSYCFDYSCVEPWCGIMFSFRFSFLSTSASLLPLHITGYKPKHYVMQKYLYKHHNLKKWRAFFNHGKTKIL